MKYRVQPTGNGFTPFDVLTEDGQIAVCAVYGNLPSDQNGAEDHAAREMAEKIADFLNQSEA